MESVKSVPGESFMSVKIRISFTEDEELAGVIRLLSPALKSHTFKASLGLKRSYLERRKESIGTPTPIWMAES